MRAASAIDRPVLLRSNADGLGPAPLLEHGADLAGDLGIDGHVGRVDPHPNGPAADQRERDDHQQRDDRDPPPGIHATILEASRRPGRRDRRPTRHPRDRQTGRRIDTTLVRLPPSPVGERRKDPTCTTRLRSPAGRAASPRRSPRCSAGSPSAPRSSERTPMSATARSGTRRRCHYRGSWTRSGGTPSRTTRTGSPTSSRSRRGGRSSPRRCGDRTGCRSSRRTSR